MSQPSATPPTGTKGWVSFRPELKVLDCTVRDGGLMNDHNFPLEFVQAIYQADVAAGVDYFEIGYKGMASMYPKDKFGVWKCCSEDDIRRVVGDQRTGTKVSVMADAERTDYKHDILPRDKSMVDMYRVATYIHQIPAALEIVNDAHDKGYETCLNIMAVSTVPEAELDSALEVIVQSPVKALYVVDSFGTLYSEQIRDLYKRFEKHTKPAGKEIGIHTHNNLQLAFANTIEAIVLGANYVDASIGGLGRGAGNCPMELALSFLHNPKFQMRPILEALQKNVEPMREELRWGFAIPYMLTGYLNQHPRTAMKFMEGDGYRDIVKFYDEALAEP
ncbi:MAG TPA: aldolase catalytic domain-containing protein [Opitutaceae bacterium]|mgnify:CR=1 FL=1|nr:aldolase catalytic domain-containing protein [Opitutaceae bacterium]